MPKLTVKLASLVGGTDVSGRTVSVTPTWPRSPHRVGQGRLVGAEAHLPTPLQQDTDGDGVAIFDIPSSASLNDARYVLAVSGGPTWTGIEMPSADTTFNFGLIDTGTPQVPLNPSTQALTRVRHTADLEGDGTGDSLLGLAESVRNTLAAVGTHITHDQALTVANDVVATHNENPTAHLKEIGAINSRLEQEQARIDGILGAIAAIRAVRPEWTHQAIPEPAGVAAVGDLARRYVLRLGEAVDIPPEARRVAIFTANRAYDSFGDVAVGNSAIPMDARSPRAKIVFTVPQSAIDIVGGPVANVNGSGRWLPMALDFLDGLGGVIEAKSVRWFVDIDATAYAVSGGGGTVDAQARAAIAALPPWATITPEPSGIPDSYFPAALDFVFTERIGTRAITAATLTLAGQTNGIALASTPGLATVTDRGRLRFTISDATRTRIDNALGGAADTDYVLTLRLSDGSTHTHNGVILVNDPAFGTQLLLESEYQSGDVAITGSAAWTTVATLTLTADQIRGQRLLLLFDASADRQAAAATLSVRLRRGTTVVRTEEDEVEVSGDAEHEQIVMFATDTPPAGQAVTYTVQVMPAAGTRAQFRGTVHAREFAVIASSNA